MRIKIVFILFFILLIPSVVFAQETIEFSDVQINLWPEYDNPNMLVIYNITLNSDISLPADIVIRIPTSAGKPHAVAAGQPDGSLIYIPSFDQQPAGDWSELRFTTTSPNIWIEYYDDALEKSGQSRSFKYFWPGDHPVANMTVLIKEPLGADNMMISPSMGEQVLGSDGLMQYRANIGSLKSDQAFSLDIRYEKEGDNLSVSELNVEPIDSFESTMNTNLDLNSPFKQLSGLELFGLAFLLLLGIGLIVGGGIWFWQSNRSRRDTRPIRSRKKTETQKREKLGSNIYCHNCGKRARSGDRFCRSCGSQLRLKS